MQLTNTNPLSLVFALVVSLTALGVFTHDAQIDNAILVALSTPATIVDFRPKTFEFKPSEKHTQIEGNLFSANISELRPQEAATQPFNKQDKKYIAKRRLKGNSFGNEYSWPSI